MNAQTTPASPGRPRRQRVSPAPPTAASPAEATTAEVTSPEAPVALSGEVVAERRSMPELKVDSLDLQQGAIGRVEAHDVAVSYGAVGGARAERVSVEMGALGGAVAGEVHVSQGAVGSVLAREVHLEQAIVRSVVAQNVRFGKPSGVLVLMAQRVEGDVRALLDWRAAAAFGAAFGLVAGLFGRGRRGRR